jgi:ABC-type transport system involved in multi-copper enzyme maturation permease subunit
VTVALGLLGTAVGVGVASLLGVTCCSMEYTNGTIRSLIVRESSRVRVALAKVLACLAIVLGFGVALAGVIAVASALVGMRLGSGPGATAPWESLHLQSPLTMLASVVVVTWLFVAVGAFGTIATKSALGGVGLALGVIVVDRLVATGVPAISRWTISYNIASLESTLQTSAFTKSATTELWPLSFSRSLAGYLGALVSIGVIALLVTMASLLVARRQEA